DAPADQRRPDRRFVRDRPLARVRLAGADDHVLRRGAGREVANRDALADVDLAVDDRLDDLRGCESALEQRDSSLQERRVVAGVEEVSVLALRTALGKGLRHPLREAVALAVELLQLAGEPLQTM